MEQKINDSDEYDGKFDVIKNEKCDELNKKIRE